MTSAVEVWPDLLTAEALADLENPSNVRLSPPGTQVVYTLSTVARKDKYPVSSLWIAQVGEEHSARQLTTGSSNDRLPQWSPDGESIAFISDRAKHGDSSAIYILSMQGGEAYPITKVENKKGISSFAWSPDGHFIAFLSPDEKTAEEERKEKEKDDAKVYAEHWEFNRLRLLHVQTREVSTLFAKDCHVNLFTWNANSTEIAYVLHETPDLNSPGYKGVQFERVSLSSKKATRICDFPGPIHSVVWCRPSVLFFSAGAVPSSNSTSQKIYRLLIDRGTYMHHAYGVTNCVAALRRVWSLDCPVVLVTSGLSDQLRFLDETEKVIYDVKQEISSWDVVLNQQVEATIILALSSGKTPTEIYSVSEEGHLCQLSQHGQAIAKLQIANAEPFYCTANDGTELDGVLLLPSNTPLPPRRPMKTAVLVHGGPYWRNSIAFNFDSFYLAPWLVSAGYAVLSPNYRGSSSRGEKFASAARGGMGTTDYSDVIDLVKAGIAKGVIDEHNVAIGGWSQGGFLSYLATTRPDFRFKAAICGAGVTDWDMMSMTSDAPWFEAELAGRAPWESAEHDTRARHGSAIWNMKDVKTPILILHGQNDVRVPLTQAIAFHRGCLHYGVPCELVVYPREGHMHDPGPERAHAVDILKRVRRFCDLHLSD